MLRRASRWWWCKVASWKRNQIIEIISSSFHKNMWEFYSFPFLKICSFNLQFQRQEPFKVIFKYIKTFGAKFTLDISSIDCACRLKLVHPWILIEIKFGKTFPRSSRRFRTVAACSSTWRRDSRRECRWEWWECWFPGFVARSKMGWAQAPGRWSEKRLESKC